MLVCAVTIVAIATQRCANYFSSLPESEEEEDSEETLPSIRPETPFLELLAPVPALEDIQAAPTFRSRKVVFGPELGSLFVPRADFVTSDMVATHTANYKDAVKMQGSFSMP